MVDDKFIIAPVKKWTHLPEKKFEHFKNSFFWKGFEITKRLFRTISRPLSQSKHQKVT